MAATHLIETISFQIAIFARRLTKGMLTACVLVMNYDEMIRLIDI